MATPIMAVAVVAAPVNAAQPGFFEPQLVSASSAPRAAVASPVRDGRRALAAGVGSERLLQVQTIRLKRVISAKFPEIRDIGGYRADSMKWHPNGLAIDVMIPNWQTPAGRALGDRIARFALDNVDKYKIEGVIWQRAYHPAHGSPKLMADLGGPDANHYTHVHIATYGGGYPKGGEVYFD
ncbi:hypothetical protein [Mycolicibacterium sp.]|uniref:hypothetical protein n=1 Tax=Mycolicibacterium sp. TaxID=2320850 RepID=UPI0028AA8853|nr:hypothetical protein [Mycolicibacterium sp.]